MIKELRILYEGDDNAARREIKKKNMVPELFIEVENRFVKGVGKFLIYRLKDDFALKKK